MIGGFSLQQQTAKNEPASFHYPNNFPQKLANLHLICYNKKVNNKPLKQMTNLNASITISDQDKKTIDALTENKGLSLTGDHRPEKTFAGKVVSVEQYYFTGGYWLTPWALQLAVSANLITVAFDATNGTCELTVL